VSDKMIFFKIKLSFQNYLHTLLRNSKLVFMAIFNYKWLGRLIVLNGYQKNSL